MPQPPRRRYTDVVKQNLNQTIINPKPNQYAPNFESPNKFSILSSPNKYTGNRNIQHQENRPTQNNNAANTNSNLKKVIVLGDSLLKYSGEICRSKGYDVQCYPGIKTEELKIQIENMDIKRRKPDIVALHVGTNNIRYGVMAEEIMGEAMDLVNHIQTESPETKIVISGILERDDCSSARIKRINGELDWLCERKGCLMVDGNCWINKWDRARDGVHLNRRGSFKLGNLLCNAISTLQGNQ